MRTLGPVTRAVLATWVVVWVASFLTGLRGAGIAGALAWNAPALLHGSLLALPGALTYTLAHDPYGVLHLLVNSLMFFWFAPEMERLWPGARFVRLLLYAAGAGAGAHLVLAALLPGSFPGLVLGGSGLVSAVLAASAAIYPDREVSLIFFRCRLVHFFLGLLALDLLWLIADLAGRGGGVAHDVHLAGAAVGWVWAGGFWRRGFAPPGAAWLRGWRARRAAGRLRREAAEEAELDRILAKIGREGLTALTAGERAFLERRSKRSRR